MVTRKTVSPGAERQKRYKRHRAGDHSLCLPGRCEHAGQTSAAAPAAIRSSERGPRGAQLWQDMATSGLGPAHRVLLEEACRIADRLDRLDAVIEGREDWLRIDVSDSGSEIRVSVDGLLAEARQQATALRGLVAELRAALPKPGARPGGTEKPKEGGLADLLAFAADRRRAPTG